ncbi:hypothetical protein Pcar_2392 [Syntrophotalea carbinolica DSM 2380]|uniref:Uncharacterized protein n=1 Tax=Syntrophotalea carbinolica (strain DSM 2380 / NBRC 103641 / GraBd1) TaxID=338963 RepID=Q3A1X6_SYNC1|nr:hypothetical protein [Syntrophotalea carbinolica]ABA89631.1 hypothetical protein Pcar_2392 [Syntrophotalea carbinolica DSM 2380]
MLRYLLMVAMCLLLGAGYVSAEEWVQERPGQKAYYDSNGKLVRVLLDTDNDKRFETEERYAGRRISRKEDRDGDGVWERNFTWAKDGSARLVEDRGRGPIQTSWFDPRGATVKVEKDKNRDGRAEITWYYEQGRLSKVVKPRGTWLYRNGQMAEAVLDTDRDGRVDRKEYYRQGCLSRAEELRPSGKVRCLWTFDKAGKPLRAEEDIDGDGRREVTRAYRKDGSVSLTVDADGNGTPEIRENYSAKGRMVSREEDLDGDGIYDLRTGRVKE